MLQVKCPKCNAPSPYWCVKPDGQKHALTLHMARFHESVRQGWWGQVTTFDLPPVR